MFKRGNNKITDAYWTDADFERLEQIQSYTEMFLVATDILNRMPNNLVQICGPISTGGAGNIHDNLLRFDTYIKKLQSEGHHVFDQMYFEAPMQRIKTLNEKTSVGYDNNILNDFYYPIFQLGKVKTFYFLQDWETSTGARWEHEKAKELDITIIYE